ncbi:MAG: hypothetical protein ACREIC_30110, partial [Limisphaerales bacterium]
FIGGSILGVTPDAPMARSGIMLVGTPTDPADAVRTLGDQLSRLSLKNGGPAKTFDTIKEEAARPAALPGGHHALLTFGVTETQRDGGKKHFKVLADMELAPLPPKGWMIAINQARAPDALFDHDITNMCKMVASWQVNAEVMNQLNTQNLQNQVQNQLANQRQWFANQQRAHQAQVSAYDQQNAAWHANQAALDQRNRNWEGQQNAQARQNDNFDEVLRGYRTVEDTRTGEKHSVDLGNVDRIVDALNEHDPDRYRQIPLRDEADPLIGR